MQCISVFPAGVALHSNTMNIQHMYFYNALNTAVTIQIYILLQQHLLSWKKAKSSLYSLDKSWVSILYSGTEEKLFT